jgi:epoxide hydrolase 4
MIQIYQQTLPHGITLSCRASGERGRPVLLFLHGFPEGAFVWDELLAHFAKPENGGYRCVAPNLRGFEKSSAPADAKAYRPKFLVQDIQALIAIETTQQSSQLAALVAHDWGGAVAWNVINQMPQLAKKLVIINSPHPGTFLRDLKSSAKQQAASEYMNFLITPEAESLLAQDDFKRLWQFLTKTNTGANSGEQGAGAAPTSTPAWLTEEVKNQYREVWNAGLTGGCNLYRASPLRPPRAGDAAAATIDLPREMLTITVPTLVIWGLDDAALPPELVDGLDDYIADLTLVKVPGASHWIVHENPGLVIRTISAFL